MVEIRWSIWLVRPSKVRISPSDPLFIKKVKKEFIEQEFYNSNNITTNRRQPSLLSTFSKGLNELLSQWHRVFWLWILNCRYIYNVFFAVISIIILYLSLTRCDISVTDFFHKWIFRLKKPASSEVRFNRTGCKFHMIRLSPNHSLTIIITQNSSIVRNGDKMPLGDFWNVFDSIVLCCQGQSRKAVRSIASLIEQNTSCVLQE